MDRAAPERLPHNGRADRRGDRNPERPGGQDRGELLHVRSGTQLNEQSRRRKEVWRFSRDVLVGCYPCNEAELLPEGSEEGRLDGLGLRGDRSVSDFQEGGPSVLRGNPFVLPDRQRRRGEEVSQRILVEYGVPEDVGWYGSLNVAGKNRPGVSVIDW